jgi:hypothetical protein
MEDSHLPATFAYNKDANMIPAARGYPLALFIIISGALLMLGGAASLAFGFEIVVTERGSAMVIGGTVAISGGLIALGIGFALLRLSQLLSTLEPRNVRPQRYGGDRPVVPLATQEPSRQAPAEPSVDRETSAFRPGTMAAAGGIAAAAVIGAGIASVAAADRKEPDSLDFTPEAPELAPLEPEADEPPEEELPLITPEDLEAELARALAETDAPMPAQQIIEPEQELHQDQELPKFLSKQGTRKSSKSTSGDETAQMPGASFAKELASQPDFPAQNPEDSSSLPLEREEEESVELHSGLQAEQPETISENNDTVTAHDHASHSTMPQNSPILGTYNNGGRTYTMYADGTVEAITEQGIQHFASMEELRLHLSSS